MELATKYNPEEVEGKWYEYWMNHHLFSSKPDARKPYTIVIPPPNVTGVLHMGHMLNIILKQLRRLGASCDWDRTAFTMDDERSESVLRVFCDLYDKGLIYRGLRMVNWDPKAQTALSNIEVIYKEEQSHLYYLRYYVADADVNPVRPTGCEGEVLHQDADGRYYAVVATTRPETIMGDTAMCINPKDPKNQWLRGHKVIVPLVGRVIPVIEDRYVEIEFGTGCLKVTPAHDVNDYNLGKTHNLETIDIFNPDGTLSETAGLYVGQDRMDVRKQIAKDLEAAGLMEKVEDYTNKVGYSERNPDTAVEPRLCMQWYLSMQHFADIALPPVLNGDIKFYPQKYVTTYRNWLENIDDWCISRQLWWGHRIPAFYLPTAEGEEERFVVAMNRFEAGKKARQIPGFENLKDEELRQDEDALDTWFSSWLWPISLFDGINHPDNPELSYYYPTADLVTGPDIIFFWVARMIMAGMEYTGKVPFRNVYFTGIVRDNLGRKMSKQLGNSPDPIALIEKYGADGVRMGMMLSAPAGNDILFDEALCEQGRNFNNKIWNAFRLVKGWEVSAEATQSEAAALAIQWFEARLRDRAAEVADLYSKYRLSEALMEVYHLFWDDFSAWLLELVKPAYGQPIDAQTYAAVLQAFDHLLHLLHPFMPFITEELWQHLADRKEGESIMVSPQQIAAPQEGDAELLAAMAQAASVVTNVRAVRNSKNISPREVLHLQVVGANPIAAMDAIVCKMAGVDAVEVVAAKSEGASAFMVGTTEYAVPLGDLIDVEAEIAKAEAELKHLEGFLAGVEKKLSNERFVANAPAAVVELERKKQSDAQSKIATLRETLAALRK